MRYVAGIMGLLLVCTTACWGQQAAPAGAKVGDKPKIAWVTVDRKAVTNAELSGRIIVIDFWATWCGPCMAEADHMVKLSQDYADKGVAILGVSLDNDVGTMRQVAANKGFTWPQVCDGRGWQSPLATAWGVKGIPCTFILSPDGEIVWRGHPAQIDANLEAAVKKYPTQPPLRAKATEALRGGLKSLSDKSFEKALAAIGEIPAGVTPDAPLTTLARQFAEKMTATAAGKEALQANDAAVKTLTALGVPKAMLSAPAAAGTPSAATPAAPAAGTGGSPPAPAVLDARLAAADKDRDAKRDLDAYSKYKWLVDHAAGTPAAEKAAAAVAAYEKDPGFLAQAKAQQREKDAASDLWMAKGLLNAGRAEQARPKLEAIVKSYPGTAAAKEAQELLNK